MSQTPEERDHTADYERALSDAEECLADIEELECKFSIGAMINYARKNGLSIAVIERLERIQRAAAVLCSDGPDAIWGFAKRRGNDRHAGRAGAAAARRAPPYPGRPQQPG
jgi:hypothetical protein